MKKICLIILVSLLCFGCSKNDHSQINDVSVGNVLDMVESKINNTFLLYIVTENCYSCDEYDKLIEELQEEKPFPIYRLSIDLQEEDEMTRKQMQSLSVLIGDITQLPMTYYFYNGELNIENKKEGYIEKRDLRKWLQTIYILK